MTHFPERIGGSIDAMTTQEPVSFEHDRLIPPPVAWFAPEAPEEAPKVQKPVPDFRESAPNSAIAAPSPSWTEIRSQLLPSAAKELWSASLLRLSQAAQRSVAWSLQHRRHTDLGTQTAGYERLQANLPAVSSLNWMDRQLVKEWRTYDFDSDDDFERARMVVPTLPPRPVWQQADACFHCNQVFGPTRLRHHCRACGRSYCQSHSAHVHPLPQFGYTIAERVCTSCYSLLLEQSLAERVAWRLARCRDYTHGDLVPYFEVGVDSLEQLATRVTQAAVALARTIPLGAQATVAVETVDVLRKYGLNGIYTILLRQEFLAAADLLQQTLGINQTSWPLSVHELTAAIFYSLAQHRAMRGMFPEREEWIHRLRGQEPADEEVTNDPEEAISEPVCDSVPDDAMDALLFYAPIALNFVYAEKEVDMQLLAAQQDWRLIYASLDQRKGKVGEQPASALFVHEETKVACLAVRGTSTIQDVVTDIRQTPVAFPEVDTKADADWMTVRQGKGLAVSGIASAAMALYREHMDSLLTLTQAGYKIRLTGHSLGGGVASLLGLLVRRDLHSLRQRDDSLETDLDESSSSCEVVPGIGEDSTVAPQDDVDEDLVRVYAFGTPSCVDSRLAEFLEPFVTTVVLHDDVVPRLTPNSCRCLLKHLLHIRRTWVEEHLQDDLLAIRNRARTGWAPRWREGFTLTSSSSIKQYCRKQIRAGKQTFLSVKEKLVGDRQSTDDFDVASRRTHDTDTFGDEDAAGDGDDELEDIGNDVEEVGDGDVQHAFDPDAPPPRMIDFMGGIDHRTQGVVLDDDEFFDTQDGDLLEDSQMDEDFADAQQVLSEAMEQEAERRAVLQGMPSDEVDDFKSEPSEGDSPGVVFLDDMPLPTLYIPGRVAHVYSHRGIYKATYIPRSFREIRRISMAGNMLSDHRTKAYYEGLLEVRSVRCAKDAPPRWTAFDEDDTCSCCASRFTWASTSRSKAQEARDKHNCRSCGTLVCDPCSQNRVSLASIGLNVPSRVCDRCYNNAKGASPTRDRRSAVVDDLALRIQASPLACS